MKDILIINSLDDVDYKVLCRANIVICKDKVIKNRYPSTISDEFIINNYKDNIQLIQDKVDIQNQIIEDRYQYAVSELVHDVKEKDSVIDIHISGLAGKGKTTLILLIHDILKQYNIDTIVDDVDILHSDIKVLRERRDTIMERIRNESNIKLSSVYKYREING